MGFKDNKPILVETPTFVPQMRMYALRNGKWLNFMISIDDHFLEFIPFMRKTGQHVVDLINEFYAKWN